MEALGVVFFMLFLGGLCGVLGYLIGLDDQKGYQDPPTDPYPYPYKSYVLGSSKIERFCVKTDEMLSNQPNLEFTPDNIRADTGMFGTLNCSGLEFELKYVSHKVLSLRSCDGFVFVEIESLFTPKGKKLYDCMNNPFMKIQPYMIRNENGDVIRVDLQIYDQEESKYIK